MPTIGLVQVDGRRWSRRSRRRRRRRSRRRRPPASSPAVGGGGHAHDRLVEVRCRRSSRRSRRRRRRRSRRRRPPASSPRRRGGRHAHDRLVEAAGRPSTRRRPASPKAKMPPSDGRQPVAPWGPDRCSGRPADRGRRRPPGDRARPRWPPDGPGGGRGDRDGVGDADGRTRPVLVPKSTSVTPTGWTPGHRDRVPPVTGPAVGGCR